MSQAYVMDKMLVLRDIRETDTPHKAARTLGRASGALFALSCAVRNPARTPGKSAHTLGNLSHTPGRVNDSPGNGSHTPGRVADKPGNRCRKPR